MNLEKNKNRNKDYHIQLHLTEKQHEQFLQVKNSSAMIRTNNDWFVEVTEAWRIKKDSQAQIRLLADLLAQIRFLKEQVAITNEMLAEHINYHGTKKVLLGIDSEAYKTAKSLVHKRMLEAQEKRAFKS